MGCTLFSVTDDEVYLLTLSVLIVNASILMDPNLTISISKKTRLIKVY